MRHVIDIIIVFASLALMLWGVFQIGVLAGMNKVYEEIEKEIVRLKKGGAK